MKTKSAENNKVLSGKWSVRQDGTAFDIMDKSGAFATCDNEAKAYLIASAPELLEALKLAYKALDTDTEQNPQDTILMETIECAIAKSEGRA